jgi:hypothetical protein
MANINLDPKLTSHFLNLYALAISDSVFDTTEIEMLYKIGKERNIDVNVIEEIIISPDKCKGAFPESLEEKVEFLYDYARIIWADGKVTDSELKTFETFCIQFGFLEENVSLMTKFFIDQVKIGTSLLEIQEMVNKTL